MEESKNLNDLKQRVNYQKKYIDNYEKFAQKILNKTAYFIILIGSLWLIKFLDKCGNSKGIG